MNSNSPKVSVIVTTHNRAHLLGRAVKSVLYQSYTGFELVIVDDASSDNTEEIVRGFDDKRIVYIRHGEEMGGPAARNTGIRSARGEYVAFLDDDDEWLPEKLERQVEKMESSPADVGLIYTGFVLVDDLKKKRERMVYPVYRGDLRGQLLRGSTIGSVSKVLVRKKCFEKAGFFDENLKSCQDWDMWKRISDHYTMDFVREPLTRIHAHERQISTDITSLILGRTSMIKKHMRELETHPDILIVHLKRLGKLNFINGAWREGMRWFGEAVKLNIFEAVKIAGWCVFELPIVKLRSRADSSREER